MPTERFPPPPFNLLVQKWQMPRDSRRLRSFADLYSGPWALPASREKAQIPSWMWSPQQGESGQRKEIFSVQHCEGNRLTLRAHSGCPEAALWKELTLFGNPRISLPRFGSLPDNSREPRRGGHSPAPHARHPWCTDLGPPSPDRLTICSTRSLNQPLGPISCHIKSLSRCWQIACSRFFGGQSSIITRAHQVGEEITRTTVSWQCAPWPHHSASPSGRWPLASLDASGTSSWMAGSPKHPTVIQKVSAPKEPPGSRINDLHYSIHQVFLKPSIMSLHFKQGTRSFITSPNPCPQNISFRVAESAAIPLLGYFTLRPSTQNSTAL